MSEEPANDVVDNGRDADMPDGEAAKKKRFLSAAARYVAVATSLPGAILAGYGIGYALDLWLHTTYLKIVFLVIGIIAGFMDLIRQLVGDMRRK